MKTGFVIVAKYPSQPPEVVDHEERRSEAQRLRTEYAMAFGTQANVTMRPATPAEAREFRG